MSWRCGVLFAGLSTIVAGGCSETREPPIPGVLKLDGEPLEGAMVTLLPTVGSGVGAVAQSTADGSFQLIPQGGQPIAPGKYKIVVTKLTLPKPGDPPPPLGSSPVPEPYRDPKTTPLEVEIPATSLELELKTSSSASGG